ncbi:MAG: hypothetical protein IKA29_02185, partial [Clostridia bacterium]|nr:hypothetical protein [Clostridia bacterium]
MTELSEAQQTEFLKYFELKQHESDPTKDKWVLKESLYFNADGTVKGAGSNSEWTVIYPGGFKVTGLQIEVKTQCTGAHDWTDGDGNEYYERNSETHIRVCRSCGRVESQGHTWPQSRITGVVSTGGRNPTYYIQVDGQYIHRTNGTLQGTSQSNALRIDDLQGQNVVKFTRPDPGSEPNYGGYGKFGLQASVFLKETNGEDLDEDGTPNENLADAFYHYQDCEVCGQIRRIGHTEENSGEFVEETDGGFLGIGATTGYFCTGCWCGGGGGAQNGGDTDIIDQTNQNVGKDCTHLFTSNIQGSNLTIVPGTSAYMLDSYDHEHHTLKCYLCGATRDETHVWVSKSDNGDGTTSFYCEKGCVSVLEGEHFDPGICDEPTHDMETVAAKAATCTKDGWTAHQRCTTIDPETGERCSYSIGKTIIPATGHNLQPVAGQPATCAADGWVAHQKCATCGQLVDLEGNDTTEEEIKLSSADVAHTYEEDGWIQTTVPTCTAAGEETRLCTVCNNPETRPVEKLPHTEVIDPAVAPTCTTTGKTEGKHCSVCGEVLVAQTEVPTVDHTWEEVAEKVPTCAEDGYTAHQVCSVCGLTQNREIISKDTVAHTYTNVVYSWTKTGNDYTACKATGTCSVCGEQESVIVEDTIKDSAEDGFKVIQPVPSTCTTNGSTTYDVDFTTEAPWAGSTSTTVVSPLDPDSHNPDAPVEENVIEVSCEVDGHKEIVVYCKDCEQEISRTKETTPKLGHDTVEDPAVPATCTTTGLTAGSHCARCGEVIVAQTVTEALGHTDGAVVVENNVAPDCENAGSYDNVTYCTVCGEETSRETVTVAALGHTEVIDAAVAPTCTTTGLTEGKHCEVCGEVLVAQTVVAKLPHTLGAIAESSLTWSSDFSTCTAPATCTVCGETVTLSATITSTIVSNATCGANGTMKYTANFAETGQTFDKIVAIATTGHVYEVGEVVESTCTDKGYTIYKCKNCDAVMHDKFTDLKPHTLVDDPAVEATCTTTGLTAGKHCSVCGTVTVAQTVTPLAAHTVAIDAAKAPTCTETGLTE